MKERKIFDRQLVYFMWDDFLKDKDCFVSDDVHGLQVFVENNTHNCVRHVLSPADDDSYPFVVDIDGEHSTMYRFVYYDPLYDVKWAWKQGKSIQCRVPEGTWLDTSNPNWDGRSLEFRIKPVSYRPFKSIQELKSTFLALTNQAAIPANFEPLIWVRSKSNVQSTFMLTHFCENMGVVYLSGHLNMGIEQLFADYTFLDGTPCGVKEE